MKRFMAVAVAFALGICGLVLAEEYQELGVKELTVNKLRASNRSVISVYDNTAISNATLKLYCSNLVVKAGGAATLPSGSVSVSSLGTGGTYPANSGASITNIGSASIADGSLLGADIRTNTIGKANLAAADFGDFTVGADGTCTIDNDAVTSAKVLDGTLLGANIRTNTIGKANLAAADFGDFTVGGDGTCTIDDNAVTAAKIGAGTVPSDVTGADGGWTVASGITLGMGGAYTGVLNIVSTTLTLVVNGTVTNVLDADITTP